MNLRRFGIPVLRLFRPARFIPIWLFCSTGIISTTRIHLYLALFLHRDYFGRPDSSLSCSFSPQGLLRPPGFIPILLFFSTGIISPRSDASLSCSFALQRLFQPPGFIPRLLFSSAGIISASQIHPIFLSESFMTTYLSRMYFDSHSAIFYIFL